MVCHGSRSGLKNEESQSGILIPLNPVHFPFAVFGNRQEIQPWIG